MDASPLLKSPCPPITAPLASLLYPCCEAGGFYCLSCPRGQEAHLSLTFESAHKHAQRCRPPVPPQSIFAALFAWQQAMIEPLQFHNYRHFPGDRYQHPPLPGRATHRGWACLVCGEGFRLQVNADAHLRKIGHQGIFSSSVMVITQRHCVPVVGSAPEQFALLTRLNATLASAMQVAGGANVLTHAVLPDVLLFGDSALSGTRHNNDTGVDPRPAYLQVLNWFGSLDKATAETVTTFLLKARSPEEEELHAAATWFFTATVAPMAASAPVAFRALVNHAFQVGGFGHQVNLFKPCTPDTHVRYAASIADALVFCYRYSSTYRKPELHNWKPGSRNDHDAVLLRLSVALSTAAVRGAGSGGRQAPAAAVPENLLWLVGEYFWVLFSQAASPNPNPIVVAQVAPPHSPPQLVLLSLSGSAPQLVTWLCCSLLLKKDSGISFASAQVCRKQAVALIFGIKAYVLCRLHGRHSGQQPLEAVAPCEGGGCVQGDPAASQLLGELSHEGTTFQLLVTVASTARYHQDAEALQAAVFTVVPSPFMGYSYRNKLICIESIHVARVHAYENLKKTLEEILCTQVLTPVPTWSDPLDLHQPMVFGSTKEAASSLANELLQRWSKGSGKLTTILRRIVWELGVALYFDLVIGPRVTEYVCLQAVPMCGMPRNVSLDAHSRVVLHVSSRKNNLSNLAVLSPALSELVIIYLAKIRPHVAALYHSSSSMSGVASDQLPAEIYSLLPGLTAEALRRRITVHFTSVNMCCIQRRIDQGQLQPPAERVQDIGPQIIRQFVHVLVERVAPAEFVYDLALLRDMLNHDHAVAAQHLINSAAWELFAQVAVQPHLIGTLALHSPQTAAVHYGIMEGHHQHPPLQLRQIHAFRDFVRCLMEQRAGDADRQFGSSPLLAAAAQRLDSVALLMQLSSGRGRQPLARAHLVEELDHSESSSQRGRSGAAPVAKRACVSADACERVDNALWLHFTAATAATLAAPLPRSLSVQQEPPLPPKPPLYRSETQRKLVHLAASGSNTLALMPTGSGKTMAVVACAMAFSRQVSLLVLPLVALELDMLERLQAFLGGPGEGCVQRFALREHQHLHQRLAYLERVRILIVSVGDLASAELAQLLSALGEAGRPLCRIFIDEVHLLLPYSSFRPDFVDVGPKLQQWGVPLIALTATAAPKMRDAIVRYVFGTGEVSVINDTASLRTNILYDVRQYCGPSGNALDAFVDLVTRELLADQRWRDTQFIIFAHTYRHCDEIYAKLQAYRLQQLSIGRYHGSVVPAEATAALFAFRRGNLRILVGTEAIGCGLDLPGVGVVLHYGVPAGSVEAFLQQSGRAARPGGKVRVGLSLVFAVPAVHKELLATVCCNNNAAADAVAQRTGLPSQSEMLAQMAAYVALGSGNCRRQWLTQALTGSTGSGGIDSCHQLAAASQHGQAIDVACCNLCAEQMGVSHHANQVRAQQVAHTELLMGTMFADKLYNARSYLNAPTLCIECTCSIGYPVTYRGVRFGQQQPCSHQSAAHFGRCFVCASKRHRSRECTVLTNCWTSSSAIARCYKCLQLKSVCSDGHTSQDEVRISFAAALVLYLGGDELWERLCNILPESLQKFHPLRRRVVDFLDQPDMCLEFFKLLVEAPTDPRYCIAHYVIVAFVDSLEKQ